MDRDRFFVVDHGRSYLHSNFDLHSLRSRSDIFAVFIQTRFTSLSLVLRTESVLGSKTEGPQDLFLFSSRHSLLFSQATERLGYISSLFGW